MKDSFCTLKWTHLIYDIELERLSSCCKSERHTDALNFSEDWSRLQETRSQMLKGIRPKVCSMCWDMEARGLESFRQTRGSEFKTEYKSVDFAAPTRLDLILKKTCDLACIYCGPHSSTRWQKKEGIVLPNSYKSLSQESLSRIQNWLPSLSEIYIYGGEPLLQEELYQILDFLMAQKSRSDLKICIITNLNSQAGRIEKFVQTLNKYSQQVGFSVRISNEALGKTAERTRIGLNFDRFNDNFHYLMKNLDRSAEIISLPTLNSRSMLDLGNYLDYLHKLMEIHQRKIYLSWNIVMIPEEFSPYRERELFPQVLDSSIPAIDRLLDNPLATPALIRNWVKYKKNLVSALS